MPASTESGSSHGWIARHCKPLGAGPAAGSIDRVEWPQFESHTLNLHLSTVGKAIMHCQKVQGRTMRHMRDLPLWDSRGQ